MRVVKALPGFSERNCDMKTPCTMDPRVIFWALSLGPSRAKTFSGLLHSHIKLCWVLSTSKLWCMCENGPRQAISLFRNMCLLAAASQLGMRVESIISLDLKCVLLNIVQNNFKIFFLSHKQKKLIHIQILVTKLASGPASAHIWMSDGSQQS